MRTRKLLALGLLTVAVTVPVSLETAMSARVPSTTPVCPLHCPPGFQVALYTWELHPERTIYDEAGKMQVPPDGVWKVSCALRCEQHAVNQETKIWKDAKELCRSGAEPGPYRGPWRITGQFVRECAARASTDCGMHCYPIQVAKPNRKGSGKKAGK